MYRGKTTRIFPIILVILVVAIAIAALVSLGRAIFSGDQSSSPAIDTSKQALQSTAIDASVQMTVRGPIVADENFRSYQVTVTPSSRDMTTYAGYGKRPIESQQLSNTHAAYEQFVYALDRANLVSGTELTGDKDDTRGICATGRLYEFAVRRGDTTVKHLWTSSCSGSTGSLRADLEQVQGLFLAQLPDSERLRATIDLDL
jgi:hypothetical protein